MTALSFAAGADRCLHATQLSVVCGGNRCCVALEASQSVFYGYCACASTMCTLAYNNEVHDNSLNGIMCFFGICS